MLGTRANATPHRQRRCRVTSDKPVKQLRTSRGNCDSNSTMQEQQESDPATKHPANHTRIAVSEKKMMSDTIKKNYLRVKRTVQHGAQCSAARNAALKNI